MIDEFFLIKPEFLDHEDKIISILELSGWTISQRQQKTLSLSGAQEMYEDCKQIYIEKYGDLDKWNEMCEYMSSSDSICLAACNTTSTDPIADGIAIKEYIRKYVECTIVEYKNLFHAASTTAERDMELELCMGIIQ